LFLIGLLLFILFSELVGNPVIIADVPFYPPYSFLDESGKPQGLTVDLWETWSEKTAIPIEFRFYSTLAEAFAAVQSGEADAINSIFYTEERAHLFDFVYPVDTESTCIFYPKTLSGFNTLQDLEGFQVGIVSGDAAAEHIIDSTKNIALIDYDDWQSLVTAAVTGKQTLFICDKNVALYYLDKAGVRAKYAYSAPLFTPLELFWCVKSGNKDLSSILLKGLQSITYKEKDAIIRRWKGAPPFPQQVIFWVGIGSLAGVLALLLVFYWNHRLKKKMKFAAKQLEEARGKIEDYHFQLSAGTQQLEAVNSQLVATNEELTETNKRLEEALYETALTSNNLFDVLELSRQLSKETDHTVFFQRLLGLGLKIIPNAKKGSISSIENGNWVFKATWGYPEYLSRIVLSEDFFRPASAEGQIVDIHQYDKEKSVPEALLETTVGIKATLMVGIYTEEQFYGNICWDFFDEIKPTRTLIRTGSALGKIASAFITIWKRHTDRDAFQNTIIQTLVKAIEMRDIYTRGHSERVASLALKLAQKLGMDSETCQLIYWAGILHDIGKIGISDLLLNKPSPLTDDEYLAIQAHPIQSARLIEESNLPKQIVPVILAHHERWDGRGYPQHLSGEEIPLEARIISLADAFDAMTSTRAYRKPYDQSRAREEIQKGAGIQFDPSLTETFISLFYPESASSENA
jgi:polar amino acid transport system substrate-binding protein